MQRNYTEDSRAPYFPPADASYRQNLSNRHNRPPLIHYPSRSNPERIAFNGGYLEQESRRVHQPRGTRFETSNVYSTAQVHGPEVSSARPPPQIRHFHSYPVNDNPTHRELLRSQEEIGRSLTYPPQHHTLDHRLHGSDFRPPSRHGMFEGRVPVGANVSDKQHLKIADTDIASVYPCLRKKNIRLNSEQSNVSVSIKAETWSLYRKLFRSQSWCC